MNKKILSNAFKIIFGIVFAISSAILSFQIIVPDYTEEIILVTMIVSFFASIFLYYKTMNENIDNFKKETNFSIICIFLAILTIYKLYLIKGMSLKNNFEYLFFNPFRLRGFIISVISASYIAIFIGNSLKQKLTDLYKELDDWDKKAYLFLSIVGLILITILYFYNSNFYLVYDKVYSLDCGYCSEKIFPNPTYYDIRHPLLSIVTFPIYAVVDSVVKFFFNGNLTSVVEAIILQFINVQLLILMGLIIKNLTQKKSIFIAYMLSFSSILYLLFFEKYILCTFLITLYVFDVCKKQKDGSILSLILSAGCMPTSCFIGILELINSSKIKEKIVKVFKIILITVLIFICLGRYGIFKNGYQDLLLTKSRFASHDYSITERLISTTKMIQNVFVALPSNALNGMYWWDSITTNINILSLVIIAIIIIGIIKNRKSFFVKACAMWTLFSFILFVGLNWSIDGSPLFIIYFSWAIVPLFMMGLEYILEKVKINKKVFYSITLSLITIINIATIMDIINFINII